MSNNDETKYDYFENLPVIHFLNLLTYRIFKAQEQERINHLKNPKQK